MSDINQIIESILDEKHRLDGKPKNESLRIKMLDSFNDSHKYLLLLRLSEMKRMTRKQFECIVTPSFEIKLLAYKSMLTNLN